MSSKSCVVGSWECKSNIVFRRYSKGWRIWGNYIGLVCVIGHLKAAKSIASVPIVTTFMIMMWKRAILIVTLYWTDID